jgi:hypothetical protein
MLSLMTLLACTGAHDLPPPVEPFRGDATLLVDGSHAGADDVTLSWVGWTRFLEEDHLAVVTSDDAGVWDLIVLFDGATAGDAQTPRQVFLKKGTQLFRDDEGTCVADLSGSGAADDPWAAILSCTDLVTEAGSPNHEDRSFSLEATIAGETFTQDDYRANRFTVEGWFAGPQLSGSPHATDGVVGFRDLDQAVVLPWRDEATWVLFDDGEDAGFDDVLLRIAPAEGEWLVAQWIRWGLDPAVGVALEVVADEDITMGVQGRDADQTGTDFTLPVWESLQEASEDSVVVVVK